MSDMTRSLDGRKWARLSLIREGDFLVPDGGFTCLIGGDPAAPLEVKKRADGTLYVECSGGGHDLAGQADDGEHLIGFWPAPGIASELVAREVLAERKRQVEKEGWSLAHDDAHDTGELARAAGYFAMAAAMNDITRREMETTGGSADAEIAALQYLRPDWEPKSLRLKGRRRELLIGAALMMAEIERLDRADEKAALAGSEDEGQAG